MPTVTPTPPLPTPALQPPAPDPGPPDGPSPASSPEPKPEAHSRRRRPAEGRAGTRVHLIIYDIRDPARWRRAHKLILGYGQRVQLSVFRVRANEVAIERLRWELERILDPADNLLIVPLCHRCAQRVSSRHEDCDWPAEEPTFRILD